MILGAIEAYGDSIGLPSRSYYSLCDFGFRENAKIVRLTRVMFGGSSTWEGAHAVETSYADGFVY